MESPSVIRRRLRRRVADKDRRRASRAQVSRIFVKMHLLTQLQLRQMQTAEEQMCGSSGGYLPILPADFLTLQFPGVSSATSSMQAVVLLALVDLRHKDSQ